MRPAHRTCSSFSLTFHVVLSVLSNESLFVTEEGLRFLDTASVKAAFANERSRESNRFADEMVFVCNPSALLTNEFWIVDQRFQFLEVDVAGATGTGAHLACVRYDMSCFFGHAFDTPFE